MHVSLEWLGALVDLDGLAPEEIAQRLTTATAEVEGVEAIDLALEGTVAEVVEHEGALALHDGRERVPGAVATLPRGARVVVGKDGALAPQPAGGAGPWLVDRTLAPGTAVGDVVGSQDVLLELDNKSLTHRPDLWGHLGFARELAAIFDRELVEPPALELAEHDGLPAIPLAIESPDCAFYSAIALRCDAAAPSPLVLQRRLAALGQRSRGLAVDVSNYVMLELAQPTHAFDGRDVDGLRVAPAERSLALTGVDDVERQIEPEDLLIWSGERPVALAGIIGSRESGIAPRSTRVVVESANFAAARVRRTQTRLGLRTDAGQRFEKSQPWRMAAVAAARVLQLLTTTDPGAVVETSYSTTGTVDARPVTITVAAEYFSKLTGIEIPREQATAVLRSLRFAVEERGGELTVGVPPFRGERDVSGPHDVLEEVARIVGYDNIAPRLPTALARPAPLGESLERERRVRRALALGHRFCEVQTYGWLDDRWLEQIGYEPSAPLELANPTAPHVRRLRTTLIPNLLAVARLNRERPGEGRIFEIGHTYEGDGGGTETGERALVGGVVWTRAKAADEQELLRVARGAVEDVLGVLRPLGPVRWPLAEAPEPWGAPGATLLIAAERERLGTVGVAPAGVAAAVGRGLRLATFELDLDAIGRVSPTSVGFVLPTVYPGSWFDLSLQWPEERGYDELAPVLEIDEPLIARREFLSMFRDASGAASYAFRFFVEAPDRTLSTEEVEDVRQRLMAAAERAGATMRSRER